MTTKERWPRVPEHSSSHPLRPREYLVQEDWSQQIPGDSTHHSCPTTTSPKTTSFVIFILTFQWYQKLLQTQSSRSSAGRHRPRGRDRQSLDRCRSLIHRRRSKHSHPGNARRRLLRSGTSGRTTCTGSRTETETASGTAAAAAAAAAAKMTPSGNAFSLLSLL